MASGEKVSTPVLEIPLAERDLSRHSPNVVTHGAPTAEPIKLFTGNANKELAARVASHLGIELGHATVGKFNDGEINIQIHDNIRNCDVFVLQSTCKPVNDNLMELFLMVRTLKRASARYVTAVIPYYGYARQDRKVKARVPISASDVAILLESAGVDRVVSVDLHCGQIQGFFHSAPVDNLFASIVFVPYFHDLKLAKPVVVSPDAGGVTRAKSFMHGLEDMGTTNVQFAMVIKQRADAGVIDSMTIIGEEVIAGGDCIIVDDIADTCGTLLKAAAVLRQKGARAVYACVAHAVFSGAAIENIAANASLDKMVTTDTIAHENLPAKVTVLSVAHLISESIKRIHQGESVSSLFSM